MLFLIGMPGVGKTYWGRAIALHYGLMYVDLDEMIVIHTGKSIPEVFKENGEEQFRKIEAEMLHQAVESATESTVISCGGGTPVFHDNMAYMASRGCTVYLEASIKYIIHRLPGFDTGRPLIDNNSSIEERLQLIYSGRKNIYEQAQYIVNAETLTVGNFAQIIEQCTHLR